VIKFKILNEIANKDESKWEKAKYYGKKALPYLAGAAVGGAAVAGLQYFDFGSEVEAELEPRVRPEPRIEPVRPEPVIILNQLSDEARKVYDIFNGNTPQHYNNLTRWIISGNEGQRRRALEQLSYIEQGIHANPEWKWQYENTINRLDNINIDDFSYRNEQLRIINFQILRNAISYSFVKNVLEL